MSTSETEDVVGSEQEPPLSTASGDSPAEDAESGTLEEVDENLEIEVEGEEESPEELDPLAVLQAKVESLEVAKRDNYDRFVRVSADLENLRKRSRREIQDGRLDERGKILKDMLPVIDNLERAVAHAQATEAEASKSIIEGVNLVLRQFTQALERNKVRAVEAVGLPFDPAVHEAVSQAPSAEHPPGTVISALQTGYMMEERLLRPALVVVSIAVAGEAVVDDAPETSATPNVESSDSTEDRE